jgi:hypothetical protein
MDDSLQLIAALQTATEGLLWMSEIDAPFEICYWPWGVPTELTGEQFLQLIGQPSTVSVEVMGVDECFAGAIEEQDWFGAEEKATAHQYQALIALLKRSLQDVQVFRVGEVRIDLYVVGHTELGNWVGVKTQGVET